MGKLEIFSSISKIVRKNKKLDFLPRKTISVKIDNKKHYISVVCDNDFIVRVILLDEDCNFVSEILQADDDYCQIEKIENNLYVFTSRNSYIYDIDNLKKEPKVQSIDWLEVGDICSNNTELYAYSAKKDKIIKLNKNLDMIDEYKNMYSQYNNKDKSISPVTLTCNNETFFAIPRFPNSEEKYYLLKQYMSDIAGENVANDNDFIHSCAFNSNNNILYINMNNVIWIIEEGKTWNYIYFKDKPVTDIFYDNDIHKLIIGFIESNGKHLHGRIVEYSDEDLKKMMQPIKDESIKEANANEIRRLK